MPEKLDAELLALESLLTTYQVKGKTILGSGQGRGDELEMEKKGARIIVKIYEQLREKKPDLKLLYAALKLNSSKYVKIAAVDVLKKLKREKSIPWLFYALEDENEDDVRNEIVQALVSLGIKIEKIDKIMAQDLDTYLNNKVVVNAY